ncbi:hypothetical protein [uncultured Tateyamaria sp.]|uniref:hypothetical protein n=1 Tax=uncultured Tateyamaria sp. TaxID=455651 RepID=UPI002636E8CB|nr:hypothetical protein [uncultured Tateyamaria sp.]
MEHIDEMGFGEMMRSTVSYLPISETYKNRLVSLCQKPSNRNRLWDEFIAPNLVVEELDQHTPVHPDKFSKFSSTGSRGAVRQIEDGEPAQVFYPFFSNPLRVPSFGPEYSLRDPRYASANQLPKQRATIGAFWVFTFEWDSDDPTALQQQLDWVWKKQPNKQTQIDTLDQHLRSAYKDYRGVAVVWSGHKSIHINLVFDPSHLSKLAIQELAARRGTSPEAKIRTHWENDIRQDAIWDYYKSKWFELHSLFAGIADIEVQFDKNLQALFQKRRTPWGLRYAEVGNVFGFPEYHSVPQAVIHESLITNSPKRAPDPFLSSTEANALPHPTKRADHETGEVGVLDDDGLIDQVTAYLRRHWRLEYPKPSHFELINEEIYLRFFNDPSDRNPSTFVGYEYSRLVYKGKSAVTNERTAYLPGYQRLGELLMALDDQSDIPRLAHLNVSMNEPQRPSRQIAKRKFERQAISGGVEGIRKGLGEGAWSLSETYPRVVIRSVEGAGKSTALIRQAMAYHLEDYIENFHGRQGLVKASNGFTIVACKSYDQAQEQYNAYIQHTDENKLSTTPVLLKSFSRLYQEYCESIGLSESEQLNWVKCLDQGYATMVDAVAALQPDIYAAVTKIKNDAWLVDDRNGFSGRLDTLIFTVHDMAQHINSPSKSKAWLHPDFDISMGHEEWIKLATEFRAFRIIHDEAAIGDLLHVATQEEKDIADRFRRAVIGQTGKPWSEARNNEKYQVYNSFDAARNALIGFYALLELVEADFHEDDRCQVNFDFTPYGRDNHDGGLYKSTHGDGWYIKQKDWWTRTRARVVITTTEELISELSRKILDADNSPVFHVEDWTSPQVFDADPIELVQDNRASAKRNDELAQCLLNDPADPFDLVIADIAKGERIVSHLSAQGRNDLSDISIATILNFVGADEFSKLNVIAQRFDLPGIFLMFYRDKINQAAGRNRGLRNRKGSNNQHRLYVSPGLMSVLNGMRFFGTGRYPAYLKAA